jgi:MFS family permease
VLTDQLSWRWVFFVTLPFAAISAWILWRHVHEDVEHRAAAPIDWTGAGLLLAGSTMLLFAVLSGADQPLARVLTLLALGMTLLAGFVWWERRVPDPVLPIDLMFEPHIASAMAGSFLIGALLFGIDTYIPLFVQGVRSGKATQAGQVITPLFLAWSISVAVAAKVVVRLGFRKTAVVGSLLIATGTGCLALGTAWPARSPALFLVGNIIVGLGMGPTSLSYILGVQNVVAWGRRGAATAATMFFRTMGGALGVGMLGASLGFELVRRLAPWPGIDVGAALRPETHARLSAGELKVVQWALGHSLRDVFLEMLLMAGLAILCSLGLRGGRAQEQRADTEPSDLLEAENEIVAGVDL